MAWMARDPEQARPIPRRCCPGCKSVIALAINYWPGESRRSARAWAATRRALRAAAATTSKTSGRKLKDLAGWLAAESGARSRARSWTRGRCSSAPGPERAGSGLDREEREPADARSRLVGSSWAKCLTRARRSTPDRRAARGFLRDVHGLLSTPARRRRSKRRASSIRTPASRTGRSSTAARSPRPRRGGIGRLDLRLRRLPDVCPWNMSFAKPAADDPLRAPRGPRRPRSGRDPGPGRGGVSRAISRERRSCARAGTGCAATRASCSGIGGDPEALPALRAAAARRRSRSCASTPVWAIARIENRRALIRGYSLGSGGSMGVKPNDKRSNNRAKRRDDGALRPANAEKTAFTKNALRDRAVLADESGVQARDRRSTFRSSSPRTPSACGRASCGRRRCPPQLAHVLECGMGCASSIPRPSGSRVLPRLEEKGRSHRRADALHYRPTIC